MRTSKLAIFALLCAVFVWPLGVLLGVVALIRINNRREELGGMGLAIAAIVIGVVFSLFLGLMAAIAIPNFLTFQCRAKQSEAKSALKSLFVSEISYDAEYERFGSLEEIEYKRFGTTVRYDVRVVSTDNAATPRTFLAEAKTNDADLDGDTWTIDQDNTLINVVEGCQ